MRLKNTSAFIKVMAQNGWYILGKQDVEMDKTGDLRSQIENMEIDLLLDAIYQHYGYDFRQYARGSIRRRIWKRIRAENLTSVSGLQEKVLHDKGCLERLLTDFSITVSDFFRNPDFFKLIRERIIPFLKTYPFVRIWHAGCSTGEEVYSLAILLHEEDVYNRCRIYATDFNVHTLERAASGVFPLKRMKQYTENYIQSGGKDAFSKYYTARYDNVVFKRFLKKNILFTHHNLVTDASFNAFNLILCRNVMIYFNRDLQAKTHQLLYNSLLLLGVLGIGEKESLKFTPHEADYELLNEKCKIYRKIR